VAATFEGQANEQCQSWVIVRHQNAHVGNVSTEGLGEL
jgi:hypothetical protein